MLRVERAAGVSIVDHAHTPAEIATDLRVLAEELPAVRTISWIDPAGAVVASTEPRLAGRSFFARDYFQEIRRGAAWRVSALVRSVLDARPVFMVARRVAGPRGELRGVLVAAVDAGRISELLGRRSAGGWTAVLDSAGTLVAIAPSRPLDWDARRRTAAHPWVARALAGEEARGEFRSTLDGEVRIGAFSPISSIGWVAHASRPLDATLAKARRNAAQDTVASALVAAAAVALAARFARRIGDPLRALERHAGDIASGDGRPLRVAGPVEVVRVAAALDAMAARLIARRGEVEVARWALEQASERAEARRAELDAIVTALPIGLAVLDHDGRVARINDRARELLALDEADLALSPEERSRRWQPVTSDGRRLAPGWQPGLAALRGERIRGEVIRILRGPEREPVWLAVSSAPIVGGSGEVRGAVTTVVDVTSLRRLQEERETLLHTVSHDLRTPLNVIVNHAELLRRRGDEEANRRGDAIAASAARMLRLVQDLVDAARLESGGVDLRLEPVELGRFLCAWRERVAGALDLARVRLQVPERVPVVPADPARLDQILTNLVSNALKYSVAGDPVDVELAVAREALRLRVRDRGQGIASDDLAHVFDRYWRATGTARAEGLGLGLFITRKLVEAHGWRVEVASELGRGTTFTVIVPLGGARTAPAEGVAA